MSEETTTVEAPQQKDDETFVLNASESELLEEFGVLLAAEYNYML